MHYSPYIILYCITQSVREFVDACVLGVHVLAVFLDLNDDCCLTLLFCTEMEEQEIEEEDKGRAALVNAYDAVANLCKQ